MLLERWSRIWKIIRIISIYRLDQWVFKNHSNRWIKLFVRFNPFRYTFKKYALPIMLGERLKIALETLGPIFVKLGQAISTREDLFSAAITLPLSQLQDRVAPFPSELAIAHIEETFGLPVKELFLTFDAQPLASASVAQVHAAKLLDGRDVIVKVLRPEIQNAIQQDLHWIKKVAHWIEKYHPEGKRLRAKAVVSEFEMTLINEQDLMREAACASQLRRNFENSNLLYVPWIYWPYTTQTILVMERIYGLPISAIDEFKKRNVNLKKLAERGVEIFFTQVFRDCFFHADMHPGNIFVDVSNPQEPRYIGVDFGIMGTLDSQDQYYLGLNFIAFFNRDYRRVAELHVESGWIPLDSSIPQFEAAIRTVCEPIFERPLSEISCAQLLIRLFQIAQSFEMPLQPQLVLLQKTLLNVEGLGRTIYPQLDLWTTAKPYLERWLREQTSFAAAFKRWKKRNPFFWDRLFEEFL